MRRPVFVRRFGTDEVWYKDQVAFIIPAIPDDATPELRDALSRRRTAALYDTCVCGGSGRMPIGVDSDGVVRTQFAHSDACTAVDENLQPIIRAYLETRARAASWPT